MFALNETAYPKIKSNLSFKEIKTGFTPTKNDIAWVNNQRLYKKARLGYLVLLKMAKRLRYFPALSDISLTVMRYIAKCADLNAVDSCNELFSSKKAYERAQKAIRKYLDLKKFDKTQDAEWFEAFTAEIAKTKEDNIDIINAMIEKLVLDGYELPALSFFRRIAGRFKNQVNQENFSIIQDALSPEVISELLNLLQEKDETGNYLWHQLKTEPVKPNTKTIPKFIEHAKWVKSLKELTAVNIDIPEGKRQQYVKEAKGMDTSKLKEQTKNKQLALIVLMIDEKYHFASDCIVDIFIKEIRRIHNKAKTDLKKYQLNAAKESEALIRMLREVASIVGTDQEEGVIEKITTIFESNPEKIVHRCDLLVGGLNEHLMFIEKRYSAPVRRTLLGCLEFMELGMATESQSLIDCLLFILKYKNENMASYTANAIETDISGDNPLDWMRERWRRILFDSDEEKNSDRTMKAKVFEMAVLSEISTRLRSGDLFVSNSRKYEDYRNNLVDWDIYNDEIGEFCELMNIPDDGKAFVNDLKNEFLKTAEKADKRFGKSEYVCFENGQLVIKKRPTKVKSNEVKKLDEAIKANMPETNIIDLLVDTVKWVDLEGVFKPLSGNKSKIDNYQKHLIATIFCYGCNIGPTQAARSMKGLSRKQISHIKLRHTTEEDLNNANDKVVNLYNEYELTNCWGAGDTASVDGTHFNVYEQNIVSEYHMRYAAQGGIGYYHVSDKYIALFSRFIPCGVRECLHLVDGLLENKSDIQPEFISGDSHAQSTVLFGFSHLLGVKLMPRIKDVKSLSMFKPDKRITYEHIEGVFSEGINWQLIRDHFKDMLRIVLSVKKGTVSASTILRRLGTESIRNKLYYAFRELGRVMRTMFLLEYLTDIEMRESIHASTCKSEEFNDFLKWVFFYNNGVIRENLMDEQNKVIKFNHLVANLIILHNTNNMTRILRKLQREGYEITDEMLSKISPYRHEHLDLLGTYPLNVNKKIKALYKELFLAA